MAHEISYKCHLVNHYFVLNWPSVNVQKNICYGNKDQLFLSKMTNIYLQKSAYE